MATYRYQKPVTPIESEAIKHAENKAKRVETSNWLKSVAPTFIGLALYFGISRGVQYWGYINEWADKYADQCEQVGKGGLAEIRPDVWVRCKY